VLVRIVVAGWQDTKYMRKAGALQKGDERILGDNEFVEKVLAQAAIRPSVARGRQIASQKKYEIGNL
jgi:hypothetical protein